jgi:hypothetical protein
MWQEGSPQSKGLRKIALTIRYLSVIATSPRRFSSSGRAQGSLSSKAISCAVFGLIMLQIGRVPASALRAGRRQRGMQGT